MAFSLPNFNLTADVWDPGHAPGLGDPPDFTAVPCQLYVLSKVSSTAIYQLRTPSNIPGFQLVVGTTPPAGSASVVEISSFPGVYWAVAFNAAVVHAGFLNEYWAASLLRTDSVGGGTYPATLPP